MNSHVEDVDYPRTARVLKYIYWSFPTVPLWHTICDRLPFDAAEQQQLIRLMFSAPTVDLWGHCPPRSLSTLRRFYEWPPMSFRRLFKILRRKLRRPNKGRI